MKLSSPQIEKSIRHAALEQMWQQPQLWKEYRLRRYGWYKRANLVLPHEIAPYLFWLYLGLFVPGHPGSAAAVLLLSVLYLTGTTLLRGHAFVHDCMGGQARRVVALLPVADEIFLRHMERKFVRAWVHVAIMLCVCYGVASFGQSILPNVGYGAETGALQALVGISIGTWLLAFFPRLLKWYLPFYVLLFACIWVPKSALETIWPGSLVLPAGWVSHGFAALSGFAEGREVWWLVPALGLALTTPLAYRRAHTRVLELMSAQFAPDNNPEELIGQQSDPETQPESAETDETQPAQTPATNASSTLWQGLARRPDWSAAGWLERVIILTLTARESLVAEFMLGDRLPSWSKQWRTGIIAVAFGIALLLIPAPLPTFLLILPIVLAAGAAAALIGGAWDGFGGVGTGGYVVPGYVFFPVGFGEVSRVMLKVNLLRALLFSPAALIYGTLLALRFGQSAFAGLSYSAECIFLALALQPGVIAARFSMTSNNLKQINLQIFLFYMGMFVLFMTVFVGDIICFTSGDQPFLLIGLAGTAAFSIILWAGYCRFFNRGKTDLLVQPNRP